MSLRLTEEQKVLVERLLPLAVRAGKWVSRDPDAESIAAYALCVWVARHGDGPHTRWRVCQYVAQRVRRELARRDILLDDASNFEARQELSLDPLSDDAAAVVRAMESSDNPAAILGLSQREYARRLAQLRAVLEVR